MFPPGLYALADDTARPEVPVLAQIQALLSGGVRVVQLRLKRTQGAAAVAVARQAVAQAHAARAVLLINDRVDWALLSQADGVHVGEEDVRPEEARQAARPAGARWWG